MPCLVLVLVLNEMVLVLDAVSSSTSTANAEYEYEKSGKLWIETPRGSNGATSKVAIATRPRSRIRFPLPDRESFVAALDPISNLRQTPVGIGHEGDGMDRRLIDPLLHLQFAR